MKLNAELTRRPVLAAVLILSCSCAVLVGEPGSLSSHPFALPPADAVRVVPVGDSSSVAVRGEPRPGDRVQGTAAAVTDGDTLRVRTYGGVLKVRLADIDAPERSQPYGPEAGRHLGSLCLGRRVVVSVRTVDMYGRIVAYVLLEDGLNLNREMLRAGYAWWYRYYSDDASLGALETQAREARRGLWADPDPENPYDYRRRMREAGKD